MEEKKLDLDGEYKNELNRLRSVKQFVSEIDDSSLNVLQFIKNLIFKISEAGIEPRIVLFFNTKESIKTINDALTGDEDMAKLRDKIQHIHGDMDLVDRREVMKLYNEGHYSYLLTTDITSRGIDFFDVTVVVNCEVPYSRSRNDEKKLTLECETYLHRVGRTGRADFKGVSISLINPKQFTKQQVMNEIKNKFGIQIYDWKSNEEIIQELKGCIDVNQQVRKNLIQRKSGIKKWGEMELHEELIDHIKNLFDKPKESQCASIPKIIDPENRKTVQIYGFPNGKGKTLSFIVPCVDYFLKNPSLSSTAKMVNKKGQERISWTPSIIVLSHTKELCDQTANVFKNICPKSLAERIKISIAYKDTDTKDVKGDILFGTAGYIQKILMGLNFDNLKYIIVDEADEVFKPQQESDLTEIFDKIVKFAKLSWRVLLFSATFKDDFQTKMLKIISSNGKITNSDVDSNINWNVQ